LNPPPEKGGGGGWGGGRRRASLPDPTRLASLADLPSKGRVGQPEVLHDSMYLRLRTGQRCADRKVEVRRGPSYALPDYAREKHRTVERGSLGEGDGPFHADGAPRHLVRPRSFQVDAGRARTFDLRSDRPLSEQKNARRAAGRSFSRAKTVQYARSQSFVPLMACVGVKGQPRQCRAAHRHELRRDRHHCPISGRPGGGPPFLGPTSSCHQARGVWGVTSGKDLTLRSSEAMWL